MPYQVKVTALRLRSQPSSASDKTIITTLPQGQLVEKLADAPDQWWQVETRVHGVAITGYVKSTFLIASTDVVAPAEATSIMPVHLTPTNPILRSASSGRAFPLNESSQPSRPIANAQALHDIINWLAVEKSPRYAPSAGKTYCNIYAYDYCYLAGVYLPRVWWTSKALIELIKGQAVTPIYDKTVQELNANSLHNWFRDYGDDFGWRRTFDLNDLQERANQGKVCIISARRVELNRSGHICAVAPETGVHRATRKGDKVVVPLQSNAGASNFRYGTKTEWWTNTKQFSSYSFWVHE